jgi:prevent-host-death family protein
MAMGKKRSIPVGEFRQRATEVVRLVEKTKEPVVITRRGRPVVELRPAAADPTVLRGSVKVRAGVDLTRPVLAPEEWEATR